MYKPRGDRIILRTGKLNRSQPSADPEGRGQGVRTPLENYELSGFWVSIGSKQLPPPPPAHDENSGTAHGSRQLIGMTTVHLGVVCKFIFAFLPENIGVGAR